MTTAVTATSITISEDQWLSDLFGYSVFRANVDSADEVILSELRDHFQRQRLALYYAKVGVTNVEIIQGLQEAGFSVVDTNVTLSLASSAIEALAPRSQPVVIGEAKASNQADILRIAETCFRHTRFHLDPKIPMETANRIKREWMNNCLTGNRGDRVFVSYDRDQVTGFLASLVTHDGNRPTAVIDLIGVDPTFQGLGVGAALTRAFIDYYSADVDEMLVGTQIANTTSLRLYQKLGFIITRSAYVLHKHLDSAS